MKFTLLICLALLFITCSGDDDRANTCSTPLTQLAWLREHIELANEGPADLSVEQGTFLNQTVFMFSLCCTTCLMTAGPPPVYTCEGNTIDNVFANDPRITDRKVIWKTPAAKASCW